MPPPLRAAAALGVSMRPMTDDDLPFVEALYASTREQELAVTGWPAEAKRAFLAQQHSAQHRHYRHFYAAAEWLIVERGGRPIGRLYLDELPELLHVIDISLVADARGEGIGSAIFADLGEMARELGKRVSIHVEVNNPARRLYERLGFRLVEDKGIYLELVWDPSAQR